MDVHARSASTGWMISPPRPAVQYPAAAARRLGKSSHWYEHRTHGRLEHRLRVQALHRKAAHPARSSPTAIGSRLPDITFRCLNSSTRLQADIAAPLRPGPAAEQAEGHGRKKRCHEGSGASSRMVRRSGIRLRSAAAAPSGLTASCAARDACKKGPGPADQGVTFGQRVILEEEHRFLPSAGDRAECG